jgi:hypothetical protein
MKQDIFAVLSDDIMGERCSTSSQMGKVKQINLWVNTDCCGELRVRCWLDDNKKLVCGIFPTREESVEIRTTPRTEVKKQTI